MALPDGPQTPRPLRLYKFIVDPLGYLEQYRQRYGDLFKVGNQPPFLIYVSHPQAIQEIFSAPPGLFKTGQGGGTVLRMLLGDQSVLMVDGDRHQRQRKLLMPPFHGDRLRTYSQIMVSATQAVTDEWLPQQPFRVRLPLQEITLRVILKAVFGLTEGDRYHQLRTLTSALLDSIGSPLSASLIFFRALQQDWGPWSPWGRFVRYKQRVDELVYAEIRDRMAAQQAGQGAVRDDILSLLMSARDEAGQPMGETELRDELMTLLLAGHETTASGLSWALYWIHAVPEVEAKLRAELATLGDRPDPSDVVRLPYLTAVCQESLRLYPVTLTTGVRVLQQPMTLAGYDLDAGTVLFPCTYLVHHRADLYPDSKQFRPERFLDRSFAPHEYLPFGGGHRYCIGAAMAMQEMKLVLATTLSRWRLSLVSDRPLKPVRRGLTIAPPNSFRMVATQRLVTPAAVVGAPR